MENLLFDRKALKSFVLFRKISPMSPDIYCSRKGKGGKIGFSIASIPFAIEGGWAKLSSQYSWQYLWESDRIWPYIALFAGKKSNIRGRTDGKSESTLHSGAYMAHNPPLSQARVLAKVCKGPATLAPVAFWGQKALQFNGVRLRGYLEPHPPACFRSGW